MTTTTPSPQAIQAAEENIRIAHLNHLGELEREILAATVIQQAIDAAVSERTPVTTSDDAALVAYACSELANRRREYGIEHRSAETQREAVQLDLLCRKFRKLQESLKLAKGVPKNYSPEERQRRAQRAKLLPRGPRKPQQPTPTPNGETTKSTQEREVKR